MTNCVTTELPLIALIINTRFRFKLPNNRFVFSCLSTQFVIAFGCPEINSLEAKVQPIILLLESMLLTELGFIESTTYHLNLVMLTRNEILHTLYCLFGFLGHSYIKFEHFWWSLVQLD